MTRPLWGDAGDRISDRRMPLFGASPDGPLRVDVSISHRRARRPLGLSQDRSVYAIVWGDDSLEPRIRKGETTALAPTMPLKVSDDVVVIIDAPNPTGNVVVGRLVSATRRALTTPLFGS